jgi:hypothetical protein
VQAVEEEVVVMALRHWLMIARCSVPGKHSQALFGIGIVSQPKKAKLRQGWCREHGVAVGPAWAA